MSGGGNSIAERRANSALVWLECSRSVGIANRDPNFGARAPVDLDRAVPVDQRARCVKLCISMVPRVGKR